MIVENLSMEVVSRKGNEKVEEEEEVIFDENKESSEERIKNSEVVEISLEEETVQTKEPERRFRVVDQNGEPVDQATFEKHFEGMYEGLFDELAEETFTIRIKDREPKPAHTYDGWNEEIGREKVEKVIIDIYSEDDDDINEECVVKQVEEDTEVAKEAEVEKEKEIGVEASASKGERKVKSIALKPSSLVPSKVMGPKKKLLSFKQH